MVVCTLLTNYYYARGWWQCELYYCGLTSSCNPSQNIILNNLIFFLIGPKAGVFIFPNKSRYEGEYREESGTPVRNGMGKFTCAVTGVVYHGEWNGDKMNGKGTSF